ncbi:hypothetical protein L491_0478 [Bordetella bronchiseptica 3E44]|nr:hypothetical protein L491_0478 [Bordetella bronchiseptica 3E44]
MSALTGSSSSQLKTRWHHAGVPGKSALPMEENLMSAS